MGRPSLAQIWTAAHVLYFAIIMTTLFVDTYSAIIALAGAAGLSWSVTIWAPFAILGKAITESPISPDTISEADEVQADLDAQSAGLTIGIHNIAIAVPQIFAALGCSATFMLFSAYSLPDALGWVLRIGACFSLAAAAFAHVLDE